MRRAKISRQPVRKQLERLLGRMQEQRSRDDVAAAFAAMRPPPSLNVHEWAEQNRILPASSPQPGRWKSRAFQIAPLIAITNPKNRKGTLYVGPSQGGGKSEILLCGMGYFVAADPSPQIFVTYSLEMAEKISKHRIAPMIRETPALRERVREARSRDSGNTIRDKEYPSGHLTLVGSNSAGSLSMHSKRVALFDEIDRYEESAGTEGDAIAIALARTKAWWNAIKIYVTSPGAKKTSRSWILWEQSDQQEWMVPCPDCGTEQILRWKQVSWQKDEAGRHLPETAVYACEHCGSAWDDAKRWAASNRGRYVATAPFRGLEGFRMSGLGIPGWTLVDIVEQWLDAQGNPQERKVFVNTVLVEWHEDEGEGVEASVLEKRAEDWTKSWKKGDVTVPAEAFLLTAFCDVQGDFIQWETVAWGHGDESWSVEYGRFFGDVRTDPTVLQRFDEEMLRPRKHASGLPIYIRGVGIDSGYAAASVYRWAKPRFRRLLPTGVPQFVFAMKGRSNEPSRPVWVEEPKKRSSSLRLNLWIVGTTAAKHQVMGRFALDEPGPGYCHLPNDRPSWWFEQLASERFVIRHRAGHPVGTWERLKAGLPNEAFDCRVGAYAVRVGLELKPFALDFAAEASAYITDPNGGPAPRGGSPPAGAAPRRPGGVLHKGVEA